jgi:CheY-like chemotaxis protein
LEPIRNHESQYDRAGGLHILLVEDHLDTAHTTASLLRLYGHCVETVADGASAVERALISNPDFILLVIGLPGIDGYEVARRLRQQQKQRVLLIAMTGHGQTHERRRAYDAGIELLLTKPVEVEELQRYLQRIQALSRPALNR